MTVNVTNFWVLKDLLKHFKTLKLAYIWRYFEILRVKAQDILQNQYHLILISIKVDITDNHQKLYSKPSKPPPHWDTHEGRVRKSVKAHASKVSLALWDSEKQKPLMGSCEKSLPAKSLWNVLFILYTQGLSHSCDIKDTICLKRPFSSFFGC